MAAGSLFTSGKFAIDPELRGHEFERLTQNLDVHFWKSFWNLTETELLAVSRGWDPPRDPPGTALGWGARGSHCGGQREGAVCYGAAQGDPHPLTPSLCSRWPA